MAFECLSAWPSYCSDDAIDSYVDGQVDAVAKMFALGSFSDQLTVWPTVGFAKMRLLIFLA